MDVSGGFIARETILSAQKTVEHLGLPRIVKGIPGGFIESTRRPLPCVTRFQLVDGRQLHLFQTGPKYYVDRNGRFRPIEEIAIHPGNTRIVLDIKAANERCALWFLHWLQNRQNLFPKGSLEFGLRDGLYWGVQPYQMAAADSFSGNPDADPESTCCDGYIRNNGSSWATERAGTTGNDVSSAGTDMFTDNDDQGGTKRCGRMHTGFDTSSIDDGGNLQSGTITLVETSKEIGDGGNPAYLSAVASSIATNTTLVAADFEDLRGSALNNPTKLTDDIDHALINGSTAWTLNSSGLANVSKTGVSNFAWREGHDQENEAPGGTGNEFHFSTADFGSNKPTLAITFSVPASSFSFAPIIGV